MFKSVSLGLRISQKVHLKLQRSKCRVEKREYHGTDTHGSGGAQLQQGDLLRDTHSHQVTGHYISGGHN